MRVRVRWKEETKTNLKRLAPPQNGRRSWLRRTHLWQRTPVVFRSRATVDKALQKEV
jgi:hypothetical protein